MVTAARFFANSHATAARAHALDAPQPVLRRLRVRQRLPVSLFECPGNDSKIAVAEPVIDDLFPLIGQRDERPEAVIAGRFEREMNVLERESECELNRKVVLHDSLKLGRLPWRHERAAS